MNIQEHPDNDKILGLMLADSIQQSRSKHNPSAEEIMIQIEGRSKP